MTPSLGFQCAQAIRLAPPSLWKMRMMLLLGQRGSCLARLNAPCGIMPALTRSASTAVSPSSSASAAASETSLGSLAYERARDVDSKWKGTSTLGGTTKNFVHGQFVDSKTERWVEVRDPVSMLKRSAWTACMRSH